MGNPALPRDERENPDHSVTRDQISNVEIRAAGNGGTPRLSAAIQEGSLAERAPESHSTPPPASDRPEFGVTPPVAAGPRSVPTDPSILL